MRDIDLNVYSADFVRPNKPWSIEIDGEKMNVRTCSIHYPPPPGWPTPPTLVEQMLRAYGKEFYGECWPGDSLHVDQLDAMAAALAVVRDLIDKSDAYNVEQVLELLGGDNND